MKSELAILAGLFLLGGQPIVSSDDNGASAPPVVNQYFSSRQVLETRPLLSEIVGSLGSLDWIEYGDGTILRPFASAGNGEYMAETPEGATVTTGNNRVYAILRR